MRTTEIVSVRLPADQAREIRERAKAANTTTSAYISRRIQRADEDVAVIVALAEQRREQAEQRMEKRIADLEQKIASSMQAIAKLITQGTTK